jgi:hypothetical protein
MNRYRKDLSQLTKNCCIFYSIVTKPPEKNAGLDPGTEKTYPGSRSQKSNGSRIRIRNTAFVNGALVGYLADKIGISNYKSHVRREGKPYGTGSGPKSRLSDNIIYYLATYCCCVLICTQFNKCTFTYKFRLVRG